jgi:hypothetical protein
MYTYKNETWIPYWDSKVGRWQRVPYIYGDRNGTIGLEILLTEGSINGVYGNVNPMNFPSAVELVDDNDNWQGMLGLAQNANVKFIVSIPTNYNLWRTVGGRIIEKARAMLGDSVVAFELGNEPNACKFVGS